MPPKSKNKAIEDKTFGMKNKNKSKKVQQYVQHLQAQVRLYNNHEKKSTHDTINLLGT